ncbi:MAG: cupredoxin domain-containing protein [bacterium]|nr:cupredoxin domain-containing protein [bacterium]
MNKYIIILIVLAVLVGGGIAYKQFSGKEKAELTGEVKEFTMSAHKNSWNWDPDTISVNQGDRVKIKVINEDDYDHGFAIDQFGVSQRVPAGDTVTIEFVASSAGEWPYYCSVSCGAGIVNGKSRGHFDQIGKLVVKSKDMMMSDAGPDKMMKE